MTDLRKAAEMALEALEWNYGTDLENIENCMAWLNKMNTTIPALRQALAQTEWVGLTDAEVEAWRGNYDFFDSALVREVEAKLKEKNT